MIRPFVRCPLATATDILGVTVERWDAIRDVVTAITQFRSYSEERLFTFLSQGRAVADPTGIVGIGSQACSPLKLAKHNSQLTDVWASD